MRLAFSTLACPAWSIGQATDAAVELGYDGLELRLLDGEIIDPHADRARVNRAVSLCRSRRLEVCALDSSCRLSRPEGPERGRELASLLAWIELAREAQVPIVRVFGGASAEGDPPTSDDEADERVAAALRSVAAAAECAAVVVALETHDAYSSAHRVAGVLSRVNSSHVSALWDSHHPYRMGETAAEVVATLGARIRHVHVKDARRLSQVQDAWQLVPMGEGEVPVRDQLGALGKMGYTGFVSVEWEKKWHPEIAEPEIALPQHIAWLRQAAADLV